ncbi:MAG TPA: hypothetical protein VF173_09115 [Thermoanaerobaculia bacterium]|nr:hypothetical protein [Thermoanaerobaculia bacterium]
MKSREYERRRRVLEEQLHADLNLIRAGYEAKLRALESIWLASDAKDEADSPPGSPNASEASPSETVSRETVRSETVASETILSETVPSETVQTKTVGEAPAPARERRDLLSDLLVALPGLPKVFEKRDIYQALGYVPARATLYRAIDTLKEDKQIVIARYSEGGQRTQYRKVAAKDAQE